MRKLTLFEDQDRGSSRSLTHDSSYVSLTDLRVPVVKAASSVFAVNGDHDPDNSHRLTDLPPLHVVEQRLLLRLQDALLLLITLGAAVQACWACGQLYRGDLCTHQSPMNVEAAAPRSCSPYEHAGAFSRTGSPDLHQVFGTFYGGWSLPNSLLHVLVAIAVVCCTVFVRVVSKAEAHHSVAWLWLAGAQLLVIFFDALTLRKWKRTTCQRLQNSIAASSHSATTPQSPSCDYGHYEAFMFAESLLAVALLGLALLEPVILRLWCSSRSTDNDDDEGGETHRRLSLNELLLLQDDDAAQHKAYRKL